MKKISLEMATEIATRRLDLEQKQKESPEGIEMAKLKDELARHVFMDKHGEPVEGDVIYIIDADKNEARLGKFVKVTEDKIEFQLKKNDKETMIWNFKWNGFYEYVSGFLARNCYCDKCKNYHNDNTKEYRKLILKKEQVEK